MSVSRVNDKHSAKQIRKRVYDYRRQHVAEWRDKAAHLLALARTFKNSETQAKLCRLAEEYDKLADEAESQREHSEP